MSVMVVGATGQLGSDIAEAFRAAGHEVLALSHAEMELASAEAVERTLQEARPELVINTAAFHNVPKCETHPQEAFAVNASGARNLAISSDRISSRLLHISTDYVFDGAKSEPYVEEDSPAPLNVYGNSKLAGEYFVRAINPRHYVVRVSAIYGHHPCRAKGGLNFVETMLKLSRERERLRVVDDEVVSPTSTAEIARQLVILGNSDQFGLFHATSEGSCSWFEFTRAIFDLTGTRTPVERALPGEFASGVARPKYSVLENAHLKRLGLNRFRHWREGLEEYLGARKEAAPAGRR